MKRRVLIVCAVFTLAACVTPARNSKPQPDPDMIEKAGDKPEATTPVAQADGTSTEKRETKPPSGKDLWTFVRVQSKKGSQFGDKQREFVERIRTNPGPGSVSEAALTIGVIQLVLNPIHSQATTFEESDLGAETQSDPDEADAGYDSPNAYSGSGPSLEKMSKERGINIPDALTENPLLGSAMVARKALEALRVGPNSQEFMNEVIFAVRARSQDWAQVSAYLGDTDTPLPQADISDTDSQYDPNVAPNPADLRGGDSLLVDAQQLADKGNYTAALKRISLIPAASPLASVAEEKRKEFSNRAVQDLRRKAARAFRSAMPSADKETRAQYLREAKAFLEQAIKEFPAAPQLPTVRENLRVISQDLERLERGRG